MPCNRWSCSLASCILLGFWQCLDLGLHYAMGFATLPHAAANIVMLFFAATLGLWLCMDRTVPRARPRAALCVVSYAVYVGLMATFVVMSGALWLEIKGPGEPVPNVLPPVIVLSLMTGVCSFLSCWSGRRWQKEQESRSSHPDSAEPGAEDDEELAQA